MRRPRKDCHSRWHHPHHLSHHYGSLVIFDSGQRQVPGVNILDVLQVRAVNSLFTHY